MVTVLHGWIGSRAWSIAIALFVAACTSQPPVPDTAPPVATEESDLVFEGQPVEASKVSFSLERAGYLACPIYYTTVLHGDGNVDWHGYDSVEQKGERHARVESAAVRVLLKRVEDLHFFDLRDDYDDRVTDTGECFLRVRVGDRQHGIHVRARGNHLGLDGMQLDDWQAKFELLNLPRCVDALAETWRWRSVPEEDQLAGIAVPTEPLEIAPGFSMKLVVGGDTDPRYEIQLDGTGSGMWNGFNDVSLVDRKRFEVPYENLRLLSERLLRASCLRRAYPISKGETPIYSSLSVHTDDQDFSYSRKVYSRPFAGPGYAANAECIALIELIELLAGTERFLGPLDERRHRYLRAA